MSYKPLTDNQFARYRQTMIEKSPTSISEWRCTCGNGATCPMILDDLWASIARGARFLCWPCAEARLGRALVKEDLRPQLTRLLTQLASATQREKRAHGASAAGAGDLGTVDDGAILGPCPSCATTLSVGHARNPHTDRVERVIIHPMPFCTYYGETDPAAIERDVHLAKEAATS